MNRFRLNRRMLAITCLVCWLADLGTAHADVEQRLEDCGDSESANCLKLAPSSESEDEIQFFSAMGLSINMCESLARDTILDLGYVSDRGPANAPDEVRYFVDPADRRSTIQIRVEENEGNLEIALVRIRVSSPTPNERVVRDVERISALYGSNACREYSRGVKCKGSREVGPYNIDLGVSFDLKRTTYDLRSRFQKRRIFEPSPQCLMSAGDATSISPQKQEKWEGEELGQKNQQMEREQKGGVRSSSTPATLSESASPPASLTMGQSAQELFKQAQAIEEMAFGQTSSEIHLKAAQLYEQAAKKGHEEAMFNLSRKYANGEGVQRNLERELKLLEQASQAGVAEAQYNLALRLAAGNGVAVNQERATELFEEAAMEGNADAQFAMAMRKLAGVGTAQSDEQALDWLEEAADNGSVQAQFMLGRVFEQGVLVPQDIDSSKKYYCLASAVGFTPAEEKCRSSFLPPNDSAKFGRGVRY